MTRVRRTGQRARVGPGRADAQTVAVEARADARHVVGRDLAAAPRSCACFAEPRAGPASGCRGRMGRSHPTRVRCLRHGVSLRGRVDIIDAYGEFVRPEARGLRAVKAGRIAPRSASSPQRSRLFRVPAAAAHPLRRVTTGLSNGYLEHGLSLSWACPGLDRGERRRARRCRRGAPTRRNRCGAARRDQRSALDRRRQLPGHDARHAAAVRPGRARFGGIDLRWMRAGVQLRGEWIFGQPFDASPPAAATLDLVVHRRASGRSPCSAVSNGSTTRRRRPERSSRSATPRRARAGVAGLAVSAGLTHQAGRPRSAAPRPSISGSTCALRQDCDAVMSASAASRPTVSWHRRLEARVAPPLGLLIVVVLGAVLAITTRLVSAQSRDRASAELEAARAAFHDQIEAARARRSCRRAWSPNCRSSAPTSPMNGWPQTAPLSRPWPTATGAI